jgi:hypothetical protein
MKTTWAIKNKTNGRTLIGCFISGVEAYKAAKRLLPHDIHSIVVVREGVKYSFPLFTDKIILSGGI